MREAAMSGVRYKIDEGFGRLLGFELVEWGPEHAVVEMRITPGHLNRRGILHGGVLASLIDTANGLAGLYFEKREDRRASVTLSLTTQFTGQASQGTIRCVARKRAGGRRIYFATAEVTDEQGRIIALGESSHRYSDPKPVASQAA